MIDSLDMSMILGILLGEPEWQRDAAWELLEPDSVHNIADLAISEAVYVLEYHYKQTRKEIAAEFQDFLTAHDDVLNYNRVLMKQVFPCYVSHPALSFNDCCLTCYAELNHAEPLFTFDQKLAKQLPGAKELR